MLNNMMSMLGHNLKGLQNLKKSHFMNEQKISHKIHRLGIRANIVHGSL